MRMVGPLVLVVAGCGGAGGIPQGRVTLGAAAHDTLPSLAALRVRCVSTVGGCSEQFTHGVVAAVSMELALAGYAVFDAEDMHATRNERDLDRPAPAPRDAFAGLAANERADLLASMGVQGVLETSLEIGDAPWYEDEREVAVEVTIRRATDYALAWTARCSTTATSSHGVAYAVKAATACALGSARL